MLRPTPFLKEGVQGWEMGKRTEENRGSQTNQFMALPARSLENARTLAGHGGVVHAKYQPSNKRAAG